MFAKGLVDIAYALQRQAWRVFRPKTRGVKIMLFNADGELVLIRNAYGSSDLFVFPGGGIRPFEKPAVAAVREVREELGLNVLDLRFRSQHFSSAEGKRDQVFLFEGLIDREPTIDNCEVREARFVAMDRVPPATSAATRRRIEEYLGHQQPDGVW
ncbi:MAG: NUDIX domain-containing protein [Pseudomonadota bacterium]|nr:NUDIX domain-containing protein [Pseudomonadota bacterium]